MDIGANGGCRIKPWNPSAEMRNNYEGEDMIFTHIVIGKGLENNIPLEIHFLSNSENVPNLVEQAQLYPHWKVEVLTIPDYLAQLKGYISFE